jgi:hypothetical protein
MQTKLYTLILSVLVLGTHYGIAQHEAFMYGKIYTIDDQRYEGAIRWGKEEVYWVDLFNASKMRNEHLRMLSDREREALNDRQYSRWFTWDERMGNWFNHTRWHGDKDYVHQFACQFGEIKVLRPTGRQYVELELQNGSKFELSGEGYNDVGNEIRIMDKEIGEVTLRWNRIERIEFTKTPASLAVHFGEPLYGTVEAYGKKFTGYIQWDHDERLSTDKLDGDSRDGKLAIEFGKIRSIERQGNRSLVVLKTGRELTMDGSNDVSRGNRGVIVMSNEFPSIDIPWMEFDKVVFEDKPKGSLPGYGEFKSQQPLKGTVKTRSGESYSGNLVYDLDEAFEYELLQGKEGEFEYTIPFRSITKISTKGEHRCTVSLKNGKQINLDDAQDVAEKNQGVLVLKADRSKTAYIPWSDVSEITFD